MDICHKVTNWVDHNRGFVGAILIGVLLSVGLVACTPETESLIMPSEQVGAVALNREAITLQTDLEKRAIRIKADEAAYNADVAALNKRVESAQTDIQEQQEVRGKLIEIVGGLGQVAVTGAVNPAQGVAAAIQIMTLLAAGGLVYDNRRKDKVIKNRTGKKVA